LYLAVDNLLFRIVPFFLIFSACVSTTRPDFDLVLASAALKAAERAQAEKKSPDLFNKAQNALWKSKRLYLVKEFEDSAKSAYEARRLAEKAELDSSMKEALE
jgi:hypothetical protein